MFPGNPPANVSCKYPLLPNEVHWILTLHPTWYLFYFLKVFAKKGGTDSLAYMEPSVTVSTQSRARLCGALWGPEALCVPHFLFLGTMLSDS